MRFRRPVSDALRHPVCFGPNDVRAQIPAVRLECEGYAPWYSDQVFRFETRWKIWASVLHLYRSGIGFLLGTLTCAVRTTTCAVRTTATARIAIAQVKPQCSVIAQNAPDLAEHINHFGNIFHRGRL